MITLKLPRSTVTQGGQFFNQATEASNRGCKLVWNPTLTYATQILDTGSFFSDEIAESIVAAGGDVTGYLYHMTMSKDKFENEQIPDVLVKYLNIDLDEPYTVIPKYIDVFSFYEPMFDTDEEGNNLETFNSYSVINSVNGELLPMSITLQLN